jgi:hypothetical protein
VLRELWAREFAHARSAFGAAARAKLGRLLAEHPPPPLGERIEVVRPARRPNAKPAICRWCGGHVGARCGQLVGHGEDTQAECWPSCPPRWDVERGETCATCGREIASRSHARRELVREGQGRWEARHLAPRPGATCADEPYETPAEMDARLAVERAQREAAAERERRHQEKLAAARAKRAAARRDTLAAERAERERQAGLEVVCRTTSEATSKDLGGWGARGRARLLRHDDELSDGSRAIRWTVRADALDVEEHYDDAEEAKAAYRSLHWLPREPRSWSPAPPPAADSCPGRDVPHCDNCGATSPHNPFLPGLGWMTASLGMACGPGCYDAMSDERGRHDRRWHR